MSNEDLPLSSEVTWSESSFVNSRNSKIYTQQWLCPDPKAVILYAHGYGDHSHWLIRKGCISMANSGISSFAFDQEGHGKSEGLMAYVPSFDALAEDTIKYIEYIKGIYPNKKLFLHGGSMGGAIVLLVTLKRPELIDGIILLAPMIRVAEAAKPHPLVVEALKGVAYLFPTWAIVPSVDIIDIAFREEKDREFARSNPLSYKGKVRLGTGLQILNVTDYLQANLSKITKPMLILHGTGDLVTAHESSEALFEAAQSTDKTLKLYEGLWHVLPLEPTAKNIDRDVKDWLDSRIAGTHTCANKEVIPFVESLESHPTAPRENPAIETPILAPAEDIKPPHAEANAPAQDPAHDIVTRERDTDAQVAMQTEVLVPADN